MNQSLAVKYRPKTFEEICGQSATITILKKQLETNNISHCYLFAGSSGCGKTTIARAFAKQINKNKGEPIEIDGASNNGVDAVRAIVDSAVERSIDSTYKIFIIDECHMITTAGWNAFLKCIEEPPEYTIFMFCTTNPEKVPETIQNRVMRFNISKIDTLLIKNRLEYICEQEGYTNYKEACDFISKMGQGGARDSIAYLEKCANYNTDLRIDNVLECLGNFSYKSFFDLTNALIDRNECTVLQIINDFYNSGKELKIFIENYLDFIIDLTKYALFKDVSSTKLPMSMENDIKYATGIENNVAYFNKLCNKILEIKNMIKYDQNSKSTIEVMMMNVCEGI